MSRDFYQLLRSFGGLSLEYSSIQEADFAATSGTSYTPPERGDFRRILGAREIQLLSDCPGVVETFQTSTASIYLPANTFSEDTNDAGNGRLFFLKNSGTSNILIKDYLGNTLYNLSQNISIQILSNQNNLWDFYNTEQKKFNGLEPNTSFVISYSGIDRTFTVTCSEDAVAWVEGIGHVCESETTSSHADVSGKYFLYYNSSGNLTVSNTEWDLKKSAPVAILYYNSILKEGILFEERHPGFSGMSDAVHENLHLTQGTKVLTGFDISGYTLETAGASNISYGISGGDLADEDLYTSLPSLTKGGPYRVIYRQGTSGDWYWDDTSVTGILDNGTDIYFNEYTGSSWQLTPITSELYINYYIFAAPTYSGYSGILAIVGQNTHPSLFAAISENPLTEVQGFKEFTTEGVFVHRLTYKRLSGNTPSNAQLISVTPINTNLVTTLPNDYESELYYRVVYTENQLVQAMSDLENLGGGAIQFGGQVELTQDRSFSFGNIRWIGSTSNDSALKLNGYVLTIGGGLPANSGGVFFQNMRFLGENSTATGFNQKVFNTSSTENPLLIYFDNCFFKNIMSQDSETYYDTSLGNPNGVVADIRNGATSVIFENCDFHSNAISDTSTTLRHAPLTIWANQGQTTRIKVLGAYTSYTGRNRYQILPPAGTASTSSEIFFSSDGTAIHYGDLPIISLGDLKQTYLPRLDTKRKYTIPNGGITSLDSPSSSHVGDGLWTIDASSSDVSFTLPEVLSSGSGFKINLRKEGSYNCTLSANSGQTIENLSSYTLYGTNAHISLFFDKENSNWIIERNTPNFIGNLNYVQELSLSTTSTSFLTVPLPTNRESFPNGLLTKVNDTDFRTDYEGQVEVTFAITAKHDLQYYANIPINATIVRNGVNLSWTEAFAVLGDTSSRFGTASRTVILDCSPGDIFNLAVRAPEGYTVYTYPNGSYMSLLVHSVI